ncbi:MAG: hypothetical protein QOE93_1611 [Actinomycetota bacterium]|jgi:hypothetical protein|nr:hypothetical protein [Actinomycetota bacterium]
MGLVELIIAVHRHLEDAGISHAFGGALALAYVAEPRGTVGVDVNVFLTPDGLDRVADAIEPLGLRREARPTDDQPPIAGVRFVHGDDPFPVDVFPALDERYREIESRRVLKPFGRGDDLLPFLSAEDLCLFKLSYGRPKDWVDLAAVATARPDLDVEVIEELLVALRGPGMYPRVARLRSLLRRETTG